MENSRVRNDVYFKTENIDTLGSTGELLLTILSGLAQECSRNQSDDTNWGILRQFESGRILVNTTRFRCLWIYFYKRIIFALNLEGNFGCQFYEI